MIRNARIATGVLLCGAFVMLVVLMATATARAEVVARSADGFILRFAVPLETTAEDVATSIAAVPAWWDPAHTYTGDASNLSLAFEPGGCWCETMADGAEFRHAEIVSITPDRVLMNAPLGPLNGKATRAELTFSSTPGNRGRLVTIEFVVEGPGLGTFADPVHGVMNGAFDRYVHHIEYSEAPQP